MDSVNLSTASVTLSSNRPPHSLASLGLVSSALGAFSDAERPFILEEDGKRGRILETVEPVKEDAGEVRAKVEDTAIADIMIAILS